ncbi:diguanylate cyclase domain-containing protein [Kineococcus sp. SYSU DK018]|uniref:diguanylate cyclase domain-containing protein n=1 Tax=Kineococcus sp. SYSU DK018 TaxID=3383139 RepID=UPI003D7F0D64
MAAGADRLRRWARPVELVERTRWLFCLIALLSAALLVPTAVRGAEPVTALLATAATALLGLVWVHRYVTRRAVLAADLAEAALVGAAVALTAPPTMVLGLAFPGLWFRAVYGTSRRALLHCTLVVAGMVGGLSLWHLVPGHDGSSRGTELLGCVPLLFVTMAGARHLASALLAREQGQLRSTALTELGRGLLSAADREEVVERALRAAVAVCGATPGLASVLVVAEPGGARTLHTAGAWRGPLPEVLTGVHLPVRGAVDDRPVRVDGGPLDALADRPGEWVAVTHPALEHGWLLVGAPDRVAAEGVPALHSVLTQSSLAMRNLDAHRALAERARTDDLTGLANRAAFTEALERAAADPAARFSVAFVDLDDFKVVNDGHGHAAGDELLRCVAQRLRLAVREGDLCARLGGDEFAVLVRGLAGAAVTDLAGRLVEALCEPVPVPGGPVRVGASVGVAHRGPGEDAEQVVQHADVAMYAAKAAGKNRVRVFTP